MLWASFYAQEQAPDDILAQDRQWSPCLFVECFCHCSPVLARLSTEEDNSHPLHMVSQDSAQEFLNVFLPSYLGALPTEFQEYCLQIPSVSQGVVCFHSDGLGCSWTFTVTVFKDLRGSLSLRAYIEMLLDSFNAQEQAPDDILAQDRQWAPCLFVECLHHGSPVFVRLSTWKTTLTLPFTWCLKTVHRNS